MKPILAYLMEKRGFDFSGYHPSMLERRIGQRLTATACKDFGEYFSFLQRDATELDHLIDVVTINVSRFFRDPLTFELISERILPAMIMEKSRLRDNSLRIWSAGCARGEEPYSLAILVQELLRKEENTLDNVRHNTQEIKHLECHAGLDKPAPDSRMPGISGPIPDYEHEASLSRLCGNDGEIAMNLHLFATDIDGRSLNEAGKAVYAPTSIENIKHRLLTRYFTPDGNSFRLLPEIKKLVHFSLYDMLDKKHGVPPESVFGAFDLVLCRNLLIYFNIEYQETIFAKLYHSLAKNGILVLGEAEATTMAYRHHFTRVFDFSPIYRKR